MNEEEKDKTIRDQEIVEELVEEKSEREIEAGEKVPDDKENETLNIQEIDQIKENKIAEEEKKEQTIQKLRPFKQWIAGIAVASLCVGVGAGVGFSFASPFQAAYYRKVVRPYVANSQQEDEAIVVGSQQDSQVTYNNGALPPECDGSIVSIAKSIGPSIVSVFNNKKLTADESLFFYGSGEETVTGLGSGIIFDEDDDEYYIMTNSHVVEGADSLAVNFVGDIQTEAKLVGKDTVNDIAVVKVDKNKLDIETLSNVRIAPLGDSDQLEVGQLAIAIGTPATEALNNTVTTGIISAVERNITISGNSMKVIQTDAAINPGNSGGALVGPTGEVIGMNVAKTVNTEGIGFSIPINKVKEVVADLMKNGSVIRPGLGITGIAVSDANASLYDLPVGIYIQTVIKGGSADLAGIKANDVLIQFDGEMITTMEQLKSLISQKRVGDLAEVKVIRSGAQKTFKLEMKEMPES